jgi:hypothetical protein
MTETSQQVWTAFAARMNDLAGVHSLTAFSVFYLLPPWVADQYSNLTSPHADSSLFIGTGDPNAEGVAHLRWRFSELHTHLDPQIGTIPRALGQQWIVMVATEWGENYRKRFAASHCVEPNAIKEAGMADIARMRNDVIHQGGRRLEAEHESLRSVQVVRRGRGNPSHDGPRRRVHGVSPPAAIEPPRLMAGLGGSCRSKTTGTAFTLDEPDALGDTPQTQRLAARPSP